MQKIIRFMQSIAILGLFMLLKVRNFKYCWQQPCWQKQFVGYATFQVCLELYEVAGPAGPYLIKLTVGHCFQMNIKSSCIKSVLCMVIAWCIRIRSSAATILTRTWFSLCEFTHIIGLNFVLLCMCSKCKTWYQIKKNGWLFQIYLE